MSNSDAYKKLLVSASNTADFRFNAYRRLLRLEHASNLALISASTALIVVSVIVALYGNELGPLEKIIALGQNCIPVILLAISIMVSSAKYGSRAEKMHECAQSLNHFKKIINFKAQCNNFTPTLLDFQKDSIKYARIISKYENHDDSDRRTEKIRNFFKDINFSWFAVIPIALVEKGWIYYFYSAVSLSSAAWICLGVYSAIRGGTAC